MKILFFSHYFPPEVNAPATRTFEHCVRWAAAGHDVTVVTCVPNCPDGVVYPGYKNRFRRQVEMVEGVRVVRVWSYLAANSGTVKRIANYVSYMLSAILASFRLPRPDVVIATSPQFFCGWAGVWVSRFKRKPFVLEIRDIWPESIEAVGAMSNKLVLRYLTFLERRMYRAADHIVAVGNGYRDNVARKIGDSSAITVLTNGVDLDRFVPAEPDDGFRKEWGLEGRFVCSYIGTIGMAHGLDVLLRAAQILKDSGRDDVRFLLVGDGAHRRPLQDEAVRLGLEQFVLFTGRLPKEAMPRVISSSDACLIHLRGCELFETVIPSKMFEFMAMRRPIIMGVRGEARQYVIDSGAGLEMEPDSAESLLECVSALASSPSLARELGSRAREYVAENFSRDVIAERYLTLLDGVVTRSGRATPDQQIVSDNALANASRS
ncbi:MAG: glycosyltransferase family 4 protein [Planctomycetaceae bacterium]